MHPRIVLVGSPGCGKDLVMKLLMAAYEGDFIKVSTSSILDGGTSDGKKVANDLEVHLKVSSYLEEKGFFDHEDDENLKGWIFNGTGRNELQMDQFIEMFCDEGALDERTHFLNFKVSPRICFKRMLLRYKDNAMRGFLRKEEIGVPEEVVKRRIRGRLAEWAEDSPGVFRAMNKGLRGHKSHTHSIFAGRGVTRVALQVVDAVGLDRNRMMDTLRKHKFLTTSPLTHESREFNYPAVTTVAQ